VARHHEKLLKRESYTATSSKGIPGSLETVHGNWIQMWLKMESHQKHYNKGLMTSNLTVMTDWLPTFPSLILAETVECILLCAYKYVQPQDSLYDPLMMQTETVSRSLDTNSIFTWLIAQEASNNILWDAYRSSCSSSCKLFVIFCFDENWNVKNFSAAPQYQMS
jgi:hypothetical protein